MHPATADTLTDTATTAAKRDALDVHTGHLLFSTTGYAIVASTGPETVDYFEVHRDGEELVHQGGVNRPVTRRTGQALGSVFGTRDLLCETCRVSVLVR